MPSFLKLGNELAAARSFPTTFFARVNLAIESASVLPGKEGKIPAVRMRDSRMRIVMALFRVADAETPQTLAALVRECRAYHVALSKQRDKNPRPMNNGPAPDAPKFTRNAPAEALREMHGAMYRMARAELPYREADQKSAIVAQAAIAAHHDPCYTGKRAQALRHLHKATQKVIAKV